MSECSDGYGYGELINKLTRKRLRNKQEVPISFKYSANFKNFLITRESEKNAWIAEGRRLERTATNRMTACREPSPWQDNSRPSSFELL